MVEQGKSEVGCNLQGTCTFKIRKYTVEKHLRTLPYLYLVARSLSILISLNYTRFEKGKIVELAISIPELDTIVDIPQKSILQGRVKTPAQRLI